MIFLIAITLLVIILILTNVMCVVSRRFDLIIAVITSVVVVSAGFVMEKGNDMLEQCKDERVNLLIDYCIANDKAKSKVLKRIEKHNDFCDKQSNSKVNNMWFNINAITESGLDFDKCKIDVDNLNLDISENDN